MREKGEELRAAVEEWQARADSSEGPDAPPRPRLLASFLDGAHPIVDVYELKVHICSKFGL
jgi:atypical dual specificity phosphatase